MKKETKPDILIPAPAPTPAAPGPAEYVPVPYPAWRVHTSGEQKLVQDEAEDKALGKGWSKP